jgi:hypothetical protein
MRTLKEYNRPEFVHTDDTLQRKREETGAGWGCDCDVKSLIRYKSTDVT